MEVILRNNLNYLNRKPMKPTYIMIHSTGCDNPNLKRYVQPDNGLIGFNEYGNHWNQRMPDGQKKCVHGFIGKLKDGKVEYIKTLPYNICAWGCGSGVKGSFNNHAIQIEVCEGGSSDYFEAVKCSLLSILPSLMDEFNIPVENVIGHQEGFLLGMASNHGDPDSYFKRFNYSIKKLRDDLRGLKSMTYEKFLEYMERYERERGSLPVPEWAKDEYQLCINRGITDGTRPMSYCTRVETACMVNRMKREEGDYDY